MQTIDKYKKNKFWNRYISELYNKPVRHGAERWYVIHVEQYAKSIPDLKLVNHTYENLIQYLTLLGCKSGIKEWLFIQHIEALEILFCNVLKVNWSDQVDWDYWYASAKQLKATHPTIAREVISLQKINKPGTLKENNL